LSQISFFDVKYPEKGAFLAVYIYVRTHPIDHPITSPPRTGAWGGATVPPHPRAYTISTNQSLCTYQPDNLRRAEVSQRGRVDEVFASYDNRAEWRSIS